MTAVSCQVRTACALASTRTASLRLVLLTPVGVISCAPFSPRPNSSLSLYPLRLLSPLPEAPPALFYLYPLPPHWTGVRCPSL